MKRINILKIATGIIFPLGLLNSCDYLDVVPPEQPVFEDTMKDKSDAVNFLTSCYAGVNSTSPVPFSTYEWSTDESVNPDLWQNNDQKTAWGMWSSTNSAGYWDALYNYNGHVHMFQKILAICNPNGATDDDKACWTAEAEFLKAYYHFRLMSMYGPIPLVDTRLDQSTPTDAFPGRSHYDYAVDWIVKKLDTYMDDLPAQRTAADWGRATKTAAMALKGRVLLYAASDLWNGRFPYTNWKNNNYETPGYGYELVSRTYDKKKWQRALQANLDAIEYAEHDGGRKLIDMDNIPQNVERLIANGDIPNIPGKDLNTAEDKEFAERVIMLRSILNSNEIDGNKEIIWGTFLQGDNQWINFAPLPK